ncbi:hypothetical protein F4814DRAFT_455689 [Daldinia grandis]|nr:hypothetical protein F4814DRAFT_455689 [Daldinia grandis]
MAEKEIARWISTEYCTGETEHDCAPGSCELGPDVAAKAFFYRSRLARMTGLKEPESEHSSHWGKIRILVRDTALTLAQAIEETSISFTFRIRSSMGLWNRVMIRQSIYRGWDGIGSVLPLAADFKIRIQAWDQ